MATTMVAQLLASAALLTLRAPTIVTSWKEAAGSGRLAPGLCVRVSTDVQARATACASGEALGLLRSSECVSVTETVRLGCDGYSDVAWIGVQHKGQTAWVDEQYLDVSSASACSHGNSSCGGGGNWSASGLSQQCLDCICHVEGCKPGCRMDVGSLSCGYFQIKETYYEDCGRPGSDWKSCADDKACATQCVIAYMQRYATRCTGGRIPTCKDYSKIHCCGPMGCRKTSTGPEAYWERVERCLNKTIE